MVADYSNLKMNLDGINTFFKDNGVQISAQDSAKLNSIFKECDTISKKKKKKPDGELTGEERTNFLNKVKSICPNLYQRVVDFYTAVDVVEGLKDEKFE